MKKENKKLAQQRRAEERRKLEFKRKLKKFLKIALPLLAALILAVTLVVLSERQDPPSSGDTSASSSSGEDTGSSGQSAGNSDSSPDSSGTDDASPSYSTDKTLTVADGDTVNIDYAGTVDGVEFDGGSTGGTGTDLVIGSGTYIDDFEEQLIGSHPGDTVEVNVTFPDPYSGDSALSGKEAVFTVTVNGIYP